MTLKEHDHAAVEVVCVTPFHDSLFGMTSKSVTVVVSQIVTSAGCLFATVRM